MNKTIILIGICILLVGCNKPDLEVSVDEIKIIEEDLPKLSMNCNESTILEINGRYELCYRCEIVNWSWMCPV